MLGKWSRKLGPSRLIALSFVILILTGTFLLCLPVSARDGNFTSPLDALFTATSATCVTGLIVADTFTKWSLFGQIVILILIQIGGIGLMSFISMFFIFMKRKLSLQERMLLMQAAGNTRLSGMVKLVRRIVSGTFLIEGCGALLLALRFIPRMGFGQGLYYAVFHAISAFCNAGFDLMGRYEAFSSLTGYASDVLVNITVMLLIIIGGIGFLVWDDILKCRLSFKNYSLHSKIVLVTTPVLLVGGAIGYFVFEQNYTLQGNGIGEQILKSFFASTTMRTAGFNTIDYASMSPSASLLSDVLMMIGGSPGSTAGGMKITTIALVFLSMVSMLRGQSDTVIGKRRVSTILIKQAAVIILVYAVYILAGTMLICHIEGLPMSNVLFEVISAVCTVGVTTGITPHLCALSHIILIILMYGGRIGGFTLMLILGKQNKQPPLRRPKENILIG